MNMKTILVSMILSFVAVSGNALTVSYPESSSYGNWNKPTHILVVGYAGGLGAQLFRVAAHRAQRYLELNPSHDVVIFGPDRVDTKIPTLATYEGYKTLLTRLELKVAHMDERWLLNDRLMDYLLKYNRIQSLDFVSHSAAHQGVGLDDVPSTDPAASRKRFNVETPRLALLAPKLAPGAFVFLHGCNSAFQQAPKLAKILGVPAAGSLTYTNFQELFIDGEWYFNDQGKFPDGLAKTKTNADSFSTPRPCSTGACHRMQPEPYPYSGFWGKLTAGLAHYKFFCGTAKASTECKKTMARALMAHMNVKELSVRTSLEDFKSAAKEYLCPDAFRPVQRAECFAAMEASLRGTPIPFTGMSRGFTTQCNFEKCDVEVRCTDTPGSCKIVYVGNNTKPITTAVEFLSYVDGFKALQAGN